MKAGYNIGKLDNKLIFIPEFLTLEEFLQRTNIKNTQDVEIIEDLELANYTYKWLLINGIDFQKSLLYNIFLLQEKIFEDFKKNKPIMKYKQEELFKEIESLAPKIEENSSIVVQNINQERKILSVVKKEKILSNHEEFLLAGNAHFTVKNEDTKNRYTFRVKLSKPRKTNLNNGYNKIKYYFVSVLTGSDNTKNYTYLGMLKITQDEKIFYLTKCSNTKNTTAVKVFQWLLKNINNLPKNVSFYHEGYCARCGRLLTVPESIKSGFGPECIKIRKRNFNYLHS